MARRDRHHDDDHDGRRPRGRGAKPFVGHWWVWFAAIPWAGSVMFLVGDRWEPIPGWRPMGHRFAIGMGDARAKALMSVCVVLAVVALSVLAYLHNARVTKRDAFVVAHVAGTLWLAALLLVTTNIFGWSLPWLIVHGCLSVVGAGSWNLGRTDALRADSRKGDGDDGGKWAKMIGLAASQPRLRAVETTEFATKIPIDHRGGETLDDVQKALPRVESLTKAIGGRGRVVRGSHAGESVMTVMHADPFAQWLRWPGLSHPGGSFADEFRTAYYDTGDAQRYWLAPDAKSGRPRTSIGRAGITGAGKSGDAAIELAEVLSRRDAVAAYVDVAKLLQNAAWAADLLTLAADTLPKARVLEAAVIRMVEDRVRRLAKFGFRDWTPAAYEHRELRMPAFYLFYDEADKVLASLAEWIATTALSTGVYMSVTLPSPDHKNIPPVVRRSIGMWKCFGCGDEYAWGFVISDKTKAAAPNPHEWGAQFAGAHLLDSAPGVDDRWYPVPARTYRAEHAELRAAVLAARAGFEPAVLPPQDIACLCHGEVNAWEMCDPVNLGGVATDPPDRSPVTNPRDAPTWRIPTDPDGPVTDLEEDDMPDEHDDQPHRTRPAKGGTDSDPGDGAMYDSIDPRRPFTADMPTVELDDGVPRPQSQTEADAEFDRALVAMTDEGVTEFSNADLLERCTLWSDSMMSKRLTAVADPDRPDMVAPPGIKLSRLKRGRYRLVFEQTPVHAR